MFTTSQNRYISQNTQSNCPQGNKDLLKNLIDIGHSINALNDVGQTALHIAAYYGKLDIIQFIIENLSSKEKVDVNIQDENGKVFCAVRIQLTHRRPRCMLLQAKQLL